MLSDGGGAMVLEDLDHARARGARIYAELAGFGMSGDAHHITAPPEDGNGARRAMQSALKDAALNPGDVQYVNAHATSTNLGDLAETRAMKDAFGDHAYKLAVSSTKSVTGHLLGAAGVLGSHSHHAGHSRPGCAGHHESSRTRRRLRLDYVPLAARKMRIDAALSNSFGFGRHQRHLGAARLQGLKLMAPSAPQAHVEPLTLAPHALLALASRWPDKYPVLLDSAAHGALSHFSMLAALPRATLTMDAAGKLRGLGQGILAGRLSFRARAAME